MSQAQVEAIIERWMTDADFRTRMRQSPLETAREEGFALSEEEKQALQRLDLSSSDDELVRQTSFGG